MITKIEAVRLVQSYLVRRSKYDGVRWRAIDANFKEFDHGWEVFVSSGNSEGGEPPTTCAFVLLVSKADGKIYQPLLTSVERDMGRLATDPSSLNSVFEPEDLDDEEA